MVIDSIKVKRTGCHHWSSMAVIAETRDGIVTYTDAAFTMRNITEKIPIGIAEDIYERLMAYQYARRISKYIIPGLRPGERDQLWQMDSIAKAASSLIIERPNQNRLPLF